MLRLNGAAGALQTLPPLSTEWSYPITMLTTILPRAAAPEVTKRTAYNRANKDHDCFVTFDGDEEQYIGSAPTPYAAEAKCDQFVFDYYCDTNTPEKAAIYALAMEAAAAV